MKSFQFIPNSMASQHSGTAIVTSCVRNVQLPHTVPYHITTASRYAVSFFYYTILCYLMLCLCMLCWVGLHHAMPCNSMPSHSMPFQAKFHCAWNWTGAKMWSVAKSMEIKLHYVHYKRRTYCVTLVVSVRIALSGCSRRRVCYRRCRRVQVMIHLVDM